MPTGTPSATNFPPAGGDGNAFAQALERARGGTPLSTSEDPFSQPYPQPEQLDPAKQAEKAKKQREALAQHLKVAPVEQHDVFSMKKKRVHDDLERTRQELLAEMRQKQVRNLELESPVLSEVTEQGFEGGKGLKHHLIKIGQQLNLFLKTQRHDIEPWNFAAKGKREKRGPGAPQRNLKSP